MRRFTPCLFLLLPMGGSLFLASCSDSNAEYKRELEKRNEKYSDYNERVQMRREARQERTDMWFDRALGKPSGDAGLRHPGDGNDDHTPAPLPPLPPTPTN